MGATLYRLAQFTSNSWEIDKHSGLTSHWNVLLPLPLREKDSK
jgi:hypothetical protein